MIRVAGLEKESFTDGVGVRYTIFFQGCNHGCVGCHNPETHDLRGGYDISIDDLMDDIKKRDYLDGVTLSGGDPIMQLEKCVELVSRIKKETALNIWLYTGYSFNKLMSVNNIHIDKLLGQIDAIVDEPYIKELRQMELKFRGSRNQNIIDVRKSIERGTMQTLDI